MTSQFSTGIYESQKDIIDSQVTDEVQRAQLASFATYLNLSWGDYHDFEKAIEVLEKECKKGTSHQECSVSGETTKLVVNSKDERGGQECTDFSTVYLEKNIFHTFYYPISVSPHELRLKLRLPLIETVASSLLREKGWSELRDYEGRPVNDASTCIFLKELSTRILNLNALIQCVMPPNKDGHFQKINNLPNYITRTPKSVGFSFQNIRPQDCLNINRVEIWFRYLQPKVVFSVADTTNAISKMDFSRQPKSEENIRQWSIEKIFGYVNDIFNLSFFPYVSDESANFTIYCESQPLLATEMSSIHTSNLTLSSNFNSSCDQRAGLFRKSQGKHDGTVRDQVSSTDIAERFVVPSTFVNLLNQRLISTYGKPDLSIQLENTSIPGATHLGPEIDYKIALIEIKFLSNLADLASSFFQESDDDDKSENISHKMSTVVTGNSVMKTKRNEAGDQDSKDTEDKLEEPKERFKSFLRQVTSYCMLEGCPFSILSNGDDYIFLFVDKFYEKIEQYHKYLNQDLFGTWKVCIVKRNEYPILMTLCSFLLGEFKKYLSHHKLANSEIVNWYQTFGGGQQKKVSHKTKSLISRRLFYDLFKNQVLFTHGLETSSFNFSWIEYQELSHVLEMDITRVANTLDRITESILEEIKNLHIWNKFHKPIEETSSLINFEVLDSKKFQIIKTLQNEIIGEHVGATTMYSRFEDRYNGVLKIYDTTRMSCSDTRSVHFRNGYSMSQTFENLSLMSYKMYMTEQVAYTIMGEREYLPKIYHHGYLYMPDLLPAGMSIDRYESPFLAEGAKRNVNSDSLFIFMEDIERANLNGVDLELVKNQALEDLAEIHDAGIFHRDISYRNIIIRKSSKADTGYRVTFLDFGLSLVSDLSKTGDSLLKEIDPIQDEISVRKVELISDEQLKDLTPLQQMNVADTLKKIDKENLEKAIVDYLNYYGY